MVRCQESKVRPCSEAPPDIGWRILALFLCHILVTLGLLCLWWPGYALYLTIYRSPFISTKTLFLNLQSWGSGYTHNLGRSYTYQMLSRDHLVIGMLALHHWRLARVRWPKEILSWKGVDRVWLVSIGTLWRFISSRPAWLQEVCDGETQKTVVAVEWDPVCKHSVESKWNLFEIIKNQPRVIQNDS